MLSEAKDLVRCDEISVVVRCFASLSMTHRRYAALTAVCFSAGSLLDREAEDRANATQLVQVASGLGARRRVLRIGNVRLLVGADWNVIPTIGVHAGYDWGDNNSTWGAGAHFNFSVPGM